MPELLAQTPPELAILPIVIDGELTDYFDSPNLLEEPLEPSPELPNKATRVLAGL